MKTLKEFGYKGYIIDVKAKFKESTREYSDIEAFYDSVLIEMSVRQAGFPIFQEGKTIEKRRENKVELHNSMLDSIEGLIDKAKLIIDKKVREEEMTNGLPESLLAEEPKEKASEEAVIEVKIDIDEDEDLDEYIYNIAKKAIEDDHQEKMKQFSSALTEGLKGMKP